MITGGCCQLPKQEHYQWGISERVPTNGTSFEMDQEKSKEKLANWMGEGYDYVVYNHCFAHEKDRNCKIHHRYYQAGKPAIALHCAMPLIVSLPPRKARRKHGQVLGASSKGTGPRQLLVNKVKKNANRPSLRTCRMFHSEGELYNVQEIYKAAVLLMETMVNVISPKLAYGSIPAGKERFSQPHWDIIIPLCLGIFMYKCRSLGNGGKLKFGRF